MSDLNELERIAAEAAAGEAESEPGPQPGQAQDIAPGFSVAEEFADFLDLMAKVGAPMLPTIPQRFTHEANLGIAGAAVKLCEKYGYDARTILLGADSTLGAWLGLAFAIGMPGFACYQDYKFLKAKEVEAAEAGAKSGENGNGQ